MDLNGKTPGSDPSEGNLTIPLTLTSATYKAPHTVPKVNPVAVAIAVLPQGPIKNKITLICNVTVVDRTNAFSVTGPKTAFGVYYLDDRYSSAQVSRCSRVPIWRAPNSPSPLAPCSPEAPAEVNSITALA